MKIRCLCGHTIYDQTDRLPHKAHFVADQDYFDLQNEINQQIEKLAESACDSESAETVKKLADATSYAIAVIIWRHMQRSIYQCPKCGRLFVDDAQRQLKTFLPENDSVPHNLMSSSDSEKIAVDTRHRAI